MTAPRMQATTFRTHNFTGANAPVTVVGDSPRYRRVVLLAVGGNVFVTDNASELSTVGIAGATPGGSFVVIPTIGANPQWVILVLGPGQKLSASAAAGVTLSVSASEAIPDALLGPEAGRSVHSTRAIPAVNANAAVQVAPNGQSPRRVVVNAGAIGAGTVFISSIASELNSGGPIPGGAFRIPQGASPIPFVLAPGQALYAAGVGAPLTSFATSIISGPCRGATGIPGAGGIE